MERDCSKCKWSLPDACRACIADKQEAEQREKEINMADWNALDAAADMREE